EYSHANSLTFGVPVEPKANELPKGLVLGRDGNIHRRFTGSSPLGDVGSSELPKCLVLGRDGNTHIRLTRSSPLGDVGCYNPPPLGARCPRRHTFGKGLALIPNCHIPAWAPTTSQARLHRSTILSILGPNHTLTVLFLGTHMSKTS
ncbi:hypothetical protein DVH24_034044, partial [Malus domestica]